MMKKWIAFISVLMMLAACAGAGAETVTAMATEGYKEEYTSYACRALIKGYDPDTKALSVTLVIPEIFARADIDAMGEGDSIWTGGREVTVVTKEKDEDGEIILNKDRDDRVRLVEDEMGCYRSMLFEEDEYIWLEMDTLDLPVTDRLILLDANDPDGGDLPVVYGADDFIAKYTADPAFCSKDIYIVLDKNGELALIYHYYVPWN